MNGEEAFKAICAAPKLEDALRQWSDETLALLITWLRAGHGRGLHGLVLGIAVVEAADRLVKAHI